MEALLNALTALAHMVPAIRESGHVTKADRKAINRQIAALCRASKDVDPERELTPSTLGRERSPEAAVGLIDAYVNAGLAVVEAQPQTLAVDPDAPAKPKGRPVSHKHPQTGRFMSYAEMAEMANA